MRTCRNCEKEREDTFFRCWNSRCCVDCDPRIHEPWRYKKNRVPKVKPPKPPKPIRPIVELGELWSPRMPRMNYRRYLRTGYWRAIRKIKIASVGGRCEKCSSERKLECHHIHYRLRGQEHVDLGCLQVLCHKCHSKVHKKKP